MPNGIFNWTFQDTVNFLKNHGSKTLKPKTLKGIIRQSGISKDIWLGKNK